MAETTDCELFWEFRGTPISRWETCGGSTEAGTNRIGEIIYSCEPNFIPSFVLLGIQAHLFTRCSDSNLCAQGH